jgi:hypothetical protein
MASGARPGAGTEAKSTEAMDARAMFAGARARTSMYESFYLRAVSPDEPVGVWIRYTVEKAAGRAPSGALWCTVPLASFDGVLELAGRDAIELRGWTSRSGACASADA